MNGVVDNHVIYRIVLELEDVKAEKTTDQFHELIFDDAFGVTWSPHENVLEALIKQKVPDLQKKTIHKTDAKIRQILLLDGIVEGFVERYGCSYTFELPSKTSSNIAMNSTGSFTRS
jgi:hypothetical protein